MTEHIISGTRFLASSLASFAWAAAWRERKPGGNPESSDVGEVSFEGNGRDAHREWVCTLSAGANVSIRSRVSGYLLRQHYREGQVVRQGDLLFELDDRPFRASMHEAMARLQETEDAIRRCEDLSAATEACSQQLNQATRATAASRAAVEEARILLQSTKIRSPIEGVAGPAKVQAGNFVRADLESLTTVTRIDPIRVHFSMEAQCLQGSLRRVRGESGMPGADSDSAGKLPLALVLPSGTVYPHTGWLRMEEHALNPGIGAIRVTAEFPNPQGVLLPGMLARVRLASSQGVLRRL